MNQPPFSVVYINLLDADARVMPGWFGIGGPQDKSPDIFIHIFKGFLLDPEIAGIRVRDNRDEGYEAKLFHEPEGVRIWYARTPEQPSGEYMVEALDASGKVRYEIPLTGPDAERIVLRDRMQADGNHPE